MYSVLQTRFRAELWSIEWLEGCNYAVVKQDTALKPEIEPLVAECEKLYPNGGWLSIDNKQQSTKLENGLVVKFPCIPHLHL